MADATGQLSSKSAEHYTPPYLVESIIKVLEQIDLDPCSNAQGQPNIPALKHYTKLDNGLILIWQGKVYMNPPYGDTGTEGSILQWVKKLVGEYLTGSVTEAIVLWRASTDTEAWNILTAACEKICFVDGRIKFSSDKPQKGPATFASVFFYMGKNPEKFEQEFRKHGQVWDVPAYIKAERGQQTQLAIC